MYRSLLTEQGESLRVAADYPHRSLGGFLRALADSKRRQEGTLAGQQLQEFLCAPAGPVRLSSLEVGRRHRTFFMLHSADSGCMSSAGVLHLTATLRASTRADMPWAATVTLAPSHFGTKLQRRFAYTELLQAPLTELLRELTVACRELQLHIQHSPGLRVSPSVSAGTPLPLRQTFLALCERESGRFTRWTAC